MPLDIIENLYLEKPSFGPSKWPRKLKPAKNSKLPKLPESHFEPFGKGGWPPISTWINCLSCWRRRTAQFVEVCHEPVAVEAAQQVEIHERMMCRRNLCTLMQPC
jgi:hypothetical protein